MSPDGRRSFSGYSQRKGILWRVRDSAMSTSDFERTWIPLAVVWIALSGVKGRPCQVTLSHCFAYCSSVRVTGVTRRCRARHIFAQRSPSFVAVEELAVGRRPPRQSWRRQRVIAWISFSNNFTTFKSQSFCASFLANSSFVLGIKTHLKSFGSM